MMNIKSRIKNLEKGTGQGGIGSFLHEYLSIIDGSTMGPATPDNVDCAGSLNELYQKYPEQAKEYENTLDQIEQCGEV